MKERTINIGLHIIVWVVFLILPILIFPKILALFDLDNCFIFNYLTISVLLVLYFYFNYYFAVPTYYFKQKYFAFTGLHVAFIIAVFIWVILFNRLNGPCVNPEVEPSLSHLSKNILPRHLLVFFVSLLMRLNKRLTSIDAKKTKTELQLLRAQVNPHFLFNVLNTIYGQAMIKSEHTADSITKLSDLMRYSLKEANVSKVALDKEIAYLESYISLQKLRLTNKTKVDFQLEGRTDFLQISPMLFIPFIENAFKYGVSNEVETTIIIILKVIDKQINFSVENTKLPNRTIIEESNKIGIKNVKSRLDLIYGSLYTLNITNTDTHYKVQLLLRDI